MANKLFISDQRMLKLMEWVVENKKATSETEFMEKIEFSRTNISNVRKGLQSFTKEHLLNAARVTGANLNWLFGLEDNMMRKQPRSALGMLKEAVIAIEIELKK